MDNNLSLYRIFYTTAETGNISAAAKKLYISQPAVSKAISKLEQNLNAPLFLRSSKGVSLTHEGQILYDHIQSAFASIQTAEDQLRNIVEFGGGHIQFGVSSTLCKYILLPYLSEFMKLHPNIQISVNCQPTNETLKMLQLGKIDIGLIGRFDQMKLSSETLHFEQIADIEDTFVATKDYLASLNGKNPFQYGTLIMLNKENLTRQYIDHYLYENQISPHQLMETTTMDLLIEFSKISLGIGCVIKQFVKKELSDGILTEISLDVPIPKRQIGFVYQNGELPSLASKLFVDYLNTIK